MSLKIGDKVIMNENGFHFYHNPSIQLDMGKVGGGVSDDYFTETFVESLAILGVGTIKRFNDSGDPYIRWENKMNGMFFHREHFFDKESVTKIGLFLKLKLAIKRLLC